MDVLRFSDANGYVTINIATRSIQNSLNRLVNRVGENIAMHYCDYKASSPGILHLSIASLPDVAATEWLELPPVMFETCEYNVTLHFTKVTGQPKIIHINRDVAETFLWYPAGEGGYLMSSLDFLNEPGIFRLQYSYIPQGLDERTEWLEFRVASPKLDTKRDYLHMMQMIHAEYENLVFKYLTKTFQNFSIAKNKSNNLIWLSIFHSVIEEYITAIGYVTNKPNVKTERKVHYNRADHIKRWTSQMCEHYEEESLKGNLDVAVFRHETIEKTVDTRENRFVKYTLVQIGQRLISVIHELKENYMNQMQEDELKWLDDKTDLLNSLLHHRFWHRIGEFGGFRQESGILQKRTGYSQIYRLWFILQSGLRLYEGETEIGIRPIWELYELWCFLKMKHLVAECLDINPFDELHQSLIEEQRETMLSPFSDNSVEHCVTYYNRYNNDIIELRYQHIYNRKSGEVHTATTEQRPDIVLNIQKTDGFVLTYLYDAKYRVMDDKNKDSTNLEADYSIADYPPPDAINQMHRYRDAIYYGSRTFEHLAKEIIGGYILFPGRYRKGAGDREPYYMESITQVNIGAFPLLPDAEHPDVEGCELRSHLMNILRRQTKYEQIVDSIPQKGLEYDNLAFVGVVPNNSIFMNEFGSHDATMYYTGESIPSNIDVLRIAFFVPVIHNRINGYYKVTSINPASKKDKLRNGTNDAGIRLFFMLGEYIPFGEENVLYHHVQQGYVDSLENLKTAYLKGGMRTN